MNMERDEFVNVVPPFPSGPIESWEKFDLKLKDYKLKYNLNFRVRSSETTTLYNSMHSNKMPREFEWTHKIYRCTHGVSQGSRSKGHRNRSSRYCKCKARFTATVCRVGGNKYDIIIRNENHIRRLIPKLRLS